MEAFLTADVTVWLSRLLVTVLGTAFIGRIALPAAVRGRIETALAHHARRRHV